MRLRSAVIILMLFLLQPVSAEREVKYIVIMPLTGLNEMKVTVADLDPGAEIWGLSIKELRSDAEQKLHIAGIKVLDRISPENNDAAHLYIKVETVGISDGKKFTGRAFHILVQVEDDAHLDRNPSRYVPGISWRGSKIAVASREDFVFFVREDLEDLLEEFLDDYRVANPKE